MGVWGFVIIIKMGKRYRRNKSKRKSVRKYKRRNAPTSLPYFKQKMVVLVNAIP